jgi:transcriptional regulator with XRE-family HTH domain
MKNTLDLGRKIRIARLLRGYSQENMAIEIGIKQQTYQLLEKGEISITEERVENICKILKMDIRFINFLDDIDLLNEIITDYLKSKTK